jgi:hypothetical protein
MEYQIIFNVGVALASFTGGWMVNRVFVLLDRIDQDMKDIREIKEMLGAIFKRLENKADK